jgi:hypothetical protein
MKKSLISKILIMFSLFLGFFIYLKNNDSLKIYAEDNENNPGENQEPETHTHDEITFVKWSETNSLPDNSGNYYLENDVTITETWHPKTDTKLCLNGHGIILNSTGKNVIEVPGGGNICIYDCTESEHKYKIDATTGLGIVDDTLESDYYTFKGGYITGAKDSPNGGAIFMPGTTKSGRTTELKMFGGTIIGNSTTGNGGAISYSYVKRNNSIITLKDVNIIANVADGVAGGIYHAANNKYLTLMGKIVIKDNVSGSSPAAIFESSELHIQDNLYIYENKLKDGKPSDITVSHPSQKDIFSLSGALTQDSKIGLDYIRRGTIYNYYPTMAYTGADKDCNELFVIHDNKIVIEEGDDLIIDYPAKDTSVPYRNIDYSIRFHNNFKPSDYEVKYGLEMGTYDLDESPTFKELGDYTIYYKVKAGLNECEYHQTVSVVKGTPQLPKANEDLYYTGEKQELLDFSNCDGVNYEFKFEGGYWSTFTPKGLDIGDYVIYTRCAGNDHYLAYASSEETIIRVKILAPVKSDLENLINESNQYYQSIKGNYPSIANIFNESINAAIEVKDNERSTVNDVAQTTEILSQAISSAKADVKAVDDTMSLIENIGTVKYAKESKDKIVAARTQYESLSNSFKDLVTNYNKLSAAEARYNELENDNNLANNVITKINEIGEVTLESAEKIRNVRNAYNSLTENQKALVSNYETLTNAEEEYAAIFSDKTKAISVDTLINEIGEVSLSVESKEKIDNAKNEYDALTERQKSFVTKYETLTIAISSYELLLADKDIATSIDELINSIGDVKLDSKDKLAEVRSKYDALTESQKTFVTKYDTLVAAEAKYLALKMDVIAANMVDELINSIGDVKYNQDTKNKIYNAKNAYSLLTPSQKSYVNNLIILTNSEKIYNDIGSVYRLINSIGDVTLDDATKSRIQNAREAYNKLDENEKTLVPNIDILTESETTYNGLRHSHSISLITIISVSAGTVVVLIFLTTYVLLFFVFNKWTLVNMKPKRVFVIGKKDNKLKLIRMNFKIVYREDYDVSKSKINNQVK